MAEPVEPPLVALYGVDADDDPAVVEALSAVVRTFGVHLEQLDDVDADGRVQVVVRGPDEAAVAAAASMIRNQEEEPE